VEEEVPKKERPSSAKSDKKIIRIEDSFFSNDQYIA
jgi:hypothetical protein